MNTEQAACKQQGSEGSGAGAPARNIHARCSLVQMMNQIWGDIDDEFSHFLTTDSRERTGTGRPDHGARPRVCRRARVCEKRKKSGPRVLGTDGDGARGRGSAHPNGKWLG